jgi:membrane-associated phospholipid phosphatase
MNGADATTRRRRTLWLVFWCAAGLLIFTLLDFALLEPLKVEDTEWLVRKDWYQALRAGGHLVLWIVVSVAVLMAGWGRAHADRRWFAPGVFIIASALAGGALAELIKLVVRRGRPMGVGQYRFSYWPQEGERFVVGTASSHVSVAFGGACALMVLWPRASIPVLIYVTGTSVTRLLTGAHFVTDVYIGALCGLASALVLARKMGMAWGRGL